MFSQAVASVVFFASLATAHFGLEYPEWRGDSFATGASQWLYPCAGVNQTATTNRTLWPLEGGSIVLDLHHPWSYVFVNLGLGTDYPSLNISLTPQFLNETGNGTFCLHQVKLPASLKVTEGQNATIQIVTSGQTGSALYNCADITFSSKASLLPDSNCTTTPGLSASPVVQQVNGSTTSTAANATSTKASSATRVGSSSVIGSGIVVGVTALVMAFLL